MLHKKHRGKILKIGCYSRVKKNIGKYIDCIYYSSPIVFDDILPIVNPLNYEESSALVLFLCLTKNINDEICPLFPEESKKVRGV